MKGEVPHPAFAEFKKRYTRLYDAERGLKSLYLKQLPPEQLITLVRKRAFRPKRSHLSGPL